MDDLQHLEGIAQAADREAMGTMPAPEPEGGGDVQGAPDFMGTAQEGVAIFATLVTGYCPKAEAHWDDGTRGRVAAALAPVLKKYGITGLDKLPPELMFLVVAGPPLWHTAKAIAAQHAAAQATTVTEKPAQPLAEKQREVAPGTPVHDAMKLYTE